ncbi:MAG: Sir2 family NAD-dependent protein deacetylase [Rikenellaceae bacterium]
MKIVVFTGAGVSAESGISTFRDSDGLWANYNIEDVCTPHALQFNRDVVVEFYNIRRKELLSAKPNSAHYAIAELEKEFDVEVVTQNIDDLHERAGSSKVLHLHGELRKLRSSKNPDAIVLIDGWEQKVGDLHEDGSLLRPFVVFFGEGVPRFTDATKIATTADILLVVGTSLAVHPAASLLNYTDKSVKIILVDPASVSLTNSISKRVIHIQENASTGVLKAIEMIRDMKP